MASWREHLLIHPAADLFPLMPPDELRALGEDIKKNGLTSPIVLWTDGKAPRQLLDGRNRLDAIEQVIGVQEAALVITDARYAHMRVNATIDPYAFVISANIHRRHLTAEQKRELIAKLIKATPEKSDRQIAETVKVSPTTVGTVRREVVSPTVQSGQLPPKRVGKDGKVRRVANKPTQKVLNAPPKVSPAIAQNRNDIAPDSSGETERLRERNEELENERQRLERHNISLRSQIEEARPGLAEKLEPHLEALFEQGTRNMVTMAPLVVMIAVTKLERLLVEYGIMPKSRRSDDPQGYADLLKQRARRQRDKDHAPKADAAQAAENSGAPPTDDGIPDFLRREAR